MPHDLKTLRRELKAIGYNVRVKTYSDFKEGTIVDSNGETLSGYFTPDELKVHREKHNAAFAILEKYQGNTFDGMFRVVLK